MIATKTTWEFPTQSELREKLSYNEKTGIFTWIKPPRNHPRLKGMNAGSVRNGTKGESYIFIKINGKGYGAHRLAWVWTHGSLPEVVDHINRDGTDNRLVNLRPCTQAQNLLNHGKIIGPSGLPVGVRKMNGKFQARVCYQGRVHHLGSFKSKEEAESAYLEKRKQLFKEFNPA